GTSFALVSNPSNVFYYTGFSSDPHERFMALAWKWKTDEFTLFVPALDLEIAKEASVVKTIIPISDDENPFQVLQKEMAEDITVIGLEMKEISMFHHHQLQMFFPEASYTDIQSEINDQRLKKSRGEIRYLQEAEDIIEKVLGQGIKKIKEGMIEEEIAAELEYLMKKFGAEGPSFSTIVLSGEKTALPHGVPGDRKLQKGDFLL